MPAGRRARVPDLKRLVRPRAPSMCSALRVVHVRSALQSMVEHPTPSLSAAGYDDCAGRSRTTAQRSLLRSPGWHPVSVYVRVRLYGACISAPPHAIGVDSFCQLCIDSPPYARCVDQYSPVRSRHELVRRVVVAVLYVHIIRIQKLNTCYTTIGCIVQVQVHPPK